MQVEQNKDKQAQDKKLKPVLVRSLLTKVNNMMVTIVINKSCCSRGHYAPLYPTCLNTTPTASIILSIISHTYIQGIAIVYIT